MALKESPSQTAGPYVHIGLTPNFSGISGIYPEDLGRSMVGAKAQGQRITIEGRVIDGGDLPLRDALVEIWQADAAWGFTIHPAKPVGPQTPISPAGGGCASDLDSGVFRFETIKPGPVPYPGGGIQAPHILFWIVARGINIGLHTRMYFAEDKTQLEADPLLKRIEHKGRLPTIVIAGKDGVYHFDIRLQGANETIFFDV